VSWAAALYELVAFIHLSAHSTTAAAERITFLPAPQKTIKKISFIHGSGREEEIR